MLLHNYILRGFDGELCLLIGTMMLLGVGISGTGVLDMAPQEEIFSC